MQTQASSDFYLHRPSRNLLSLLPSRRLASEMDFELTRHVKCKSQSNLSAGDACA